MRWTPTHSYFAFAALFFLAAGVSVIVEKLGMPMVFAFSTLCSVFLVFGALESKGSDSETSE
ncbi:MAG: hypothetical protein AAGA81_07745 [Acidobacteriota bacterium]